MARQASDLLTRLVDKGEDALQRVSEAPAAHRMLDTVTTLRGRVDELQKRLRGLDALEKRVATLERRIDALAKPATRTTTAARKPAAKKPAGPRKAS